MLLTRERWRAFLTAGLSAGGLALSLGLWGAGVGEVNLPWAPAWDLRLSLRFDGLAALYTLLATASAP